MFSTHMSHFDIQLVLSSELMRLLLRERHVTMHEVRKLSFDIELVLVFELMHLLLCEHQVSMHEVRKLRAREMESIDVAMGCFLSAMN